MSVEWDERTVFIAKALARADGHRDPDELVEVKTCGGTMKLPRWMHQYGYLAHAAQVAAETFDQSRRVALPGCPIP